MQARRKSSIPLRFLLNIIKSMLINRRYMQNEVCVHENQLHLCTVPVYLRIQCDSFIKQNKTVNIV